jgi:hypothetical protein
MWRSFFLACGIAMLIVGAEFMVVERVVLAGGKSEAAASDSRFFQLGQRPAVSKKEIVPPDWAPWSLMSAGAVVIIYSFTIPKRVAA